MFCRKCGAQISDDANVCPYCGERVVLVNNYTSERRTNSFAIAGFILSFISPILGWIFGGIGLKRSNNRYGGRAMSLAAIIIATLLFAYNVYLVATGQLDDMLKEIQDLFNQ